MHIYAHIYIYIYSSSSWIERAGSSSSELELVYISIYIYIYSSSSSLEVARAGEGGREGDLPPSLPLSLPLSVSLSLSLSVSLPPSLSLSLSLLSLSPSLAISLSLSHSCVCVCPPPHNPGRRRRPPGVIFERVKPFRPRQHALDTRVDGTSKPPQLFPAARVCQIPPAPDLLCAPTHRCVWLYSVLPTPFSTLIFKLFDVLILVWRSFCIPVDPSSMC